MDVLLFCCCSLVVEGWKLREVNNQEWKLKLWTHTAAFCTYCNNDNSSPKENKSTRACKKVSTHTHTRMHTQLFPNISICSYIPLIRTVYESDVQGKSSFPSSPEFPCSLCSVTVFKGVIMTNPNTFGHNADGRCFLYGIPCQCYGVTMENQNPISLN